MAFIERGLWIRDVEYGEMNRGKPNREVGWNLVSGEELRSRVYIVHERYSTSINNGVGILKTKSRDWLFKL